MEPTKLIPFVEVTATPSDYEESATWTFKTNPDLTPDQNEAAIIDQLLEIWSYLCNNRYRKMQRRNLWQLHPHLHDFRAVREGYTKFDRNVYRVGINISGICQMMYNMEKWYVPLVYGKEIIKWYARQYPVTVEGVLDALNKRNPTTLTMNRYTQHVRNFFRSQTETIQRENLAHLCHDMYASNFRPDYLSEAVGEPFIKGFIKPIHCSWEEYNVDPVYLTAAKLYASLLIACMAITNEGKPVDNMCCIELWGALQMFIEDGYPRERIEELIHEVQLFKTRNGCANWNLVMTKEW